MAGEQDKYSFWLTACKLPDGKAHLPLARTKHHRVISFLMKCGKQTYIYCSMGHATNCKVIANLLSC